MFSLIIGGPGLHGIKAHAQIFDGIGKLLGHMYFQFG
jgi:hypothetical protein